MRIDDFIVARLAEEREDPDRHGDPIPSEVLDALALIAQINASSVVEPEPDERTLHEQRRHPDYEYLTVETGRKTDEDDSPPEDEGWEPNDFVRVLEFPQAPEGGWSGEEPIEIGRRNWERFDHTEETYYRRLRDEPRKPFINQTLRAIAGIWGSHEHYQPEWGVQ